MAARIDSLSLTIFFYDISNPPSKSNNAIVNLALASTNVVNLSKMVVGPPTRGKLIIEDPRSFGMLGFNATEYEYAIRDILLSANLVLTHAVISDVEKTFREYEVKFTNPPVLVNSDGTETLTKLKPTRLTLVVTGHVDETLDVDLLVSIYNLVSRFRQHALQNSSRLEVVSITNSLNQFDSAMRAGDKVTIFKNLFNSLELATNSNIAEKKGPDFDTEVVSLVASLNPGLTPSMIEQWRETYNRVKHTPQSPADVASYVEGQRQLGMHLEPLRRTCAKILVDKMKVI